MRGRSAVPYAPVTIKTDAGTGVLTVLAERQNDFPGVVQQPVSIRAYPYGDMAAQALGYVGQVSEPELKLRAFAGVKQGTVVGQEGLEYYYDRYLRGRPGVQRVEVNAAGYPVPSKLAPTQPLAGYSLKVTLDRGLQQEGEKALLEGIERARAGGKPALAGAFTALDPRTGRSSRWAPIRPSTRTSSPNRSPRPNTPRSRAKALAPAAAKNRPAAHRPGRQRHLSDRLDVQADHRDGGARRGCHHPVGGPRRRSVHLRVDRAVLQRRQGRLWSGGAGRSAEGLLGHLLLRSGGARQQLRQRDPEGGPPSWGSASRPASTCRASSKASFPMRHGARRRTAWRSNASTALTAPRAAMSRK